MRSQSLTLISTADLDALHEALRSGRLRGPVTASKLASAGLAVDERVVLRACQDPDLIIAADVMTSAARLVYARGMVFILLLAGHGPSFPRRGDPA